MKGNNLPRTYDQVADELRRKIGDVSKMIFQTESAILAQKHREFVEAGGCETCRGRGFVVVWDTIDSLSGCYAEYGECPNPNCTAKETGPDFGCERSKYDDLKNVPKYYFAGDPAWKAAARPLLEIKEKLERELSEIRTEVREDDDIVVVKGRKVPIGTTGRVFWKGYPKTTGNQYGHRVGFKSRAPDGTEQTYWNSIVNVARVYTG